MGGHRRELAPWIAAVMGCAFAGMDHCSCASLRGEKPGELPIQANGADEGGMVI
jgi:hypothetical protein